MQTFPAIVNQGTITKMTIVLGHSSIMMTEIDYLTQKDAL